MNASFTDINTSSSNFMDGYYTNFAAYSLFNDLCDPGIYTWTGIENLNSGYDNPDVFKGNAPVYAYFQNNRNQEVYIHGIRVTTPTNSTVNIKETVAPKSRIFFEGNRVVLNEATDIKVYNANGLLMNAAHTDRMDLSNMPKGIYIVKAGDAIRLSGMKFTDAEIEELARRIRKMKEQGTHLCCSIGFLTEKQAKMLKDAGLDRINHNLNSSRAYYHNICTTHTFEQRVANIRMLQGLGFEICSGGIIGMGESKEDVVDMLLELREIQPEALPINFLLPIKGTPLGDADISGLTTEYCMKVLCLARLLVPKSDIRCAAGREVYFKGEEKKLLSVVDSIFASGYLTAGGQGIQDTIKTITDAGFTYEIESA